MVSCPIVTKSHDFSKVFSFTASIQLYGKALSTRFRHTKQEPSSFRIIGLLKNKRGRDELNQSYVACLLGVQFLSVDDIELNLLTYLQSHEDVDSSFKCAEVEEKILVPILGSNESVSLILLTTLYSTKHK